MDYVEKLQEIELLKSIEAKARQEGNIWTADMAASEIAILKDEIISSAKELP